MKKEGMNKSISSGSGTGSQILFPEPKKEEKKKDQIQNPEHSPQCQSQIC